MDEDQLNDLKQFIAATVSQATADMATKQDIANMATKDDLARLESKLENKIEDLRLEMNDGFAGVSDAIEQINEQCADMDQRLTKLEQQTA
jgi:phage shock protein A